MNGDVFLRHGSAAHAHDRRPGGRISDIRSDASRSRLASLDQASAQADDRQDQRDLQAYGKDGQESSQRSVLQVLDYEFVDQPTIVRSGTVLPYVEASMPLKLPENMFWTSRWTCFGVSGKPSSVSSMYWLKSMSAITRRECVHL